MIHTNTIEAVREFPIEEIIGRYVDLKQAGASLKACCPLHGEKTPSFMVFKKNNSFRCFGCGAGGDAIQFVMLHDNLPFIEAIRAIATTHGIEIKETASTQTPEQKNEEEKIMQLIQEAQATYRKLLFA